MRISINIKTALIVIFLFIIIYNPPVVKGLSFTMVFSIISFIYIVLNINYLLYILSNRTLKKFLSLMALFLIYYFIEAIINSLSTNIGLSIMSDWGAFFVQCIAGVFVSLSIVLYFLKNNYTLNYLLKCLIYVALLQCFFVFASLVSPSIKNSLVNLMLNDVSANKKWVFQYESGFRNFGFASSLYDIFGYTTSILALVSLDLAIKGEKRFYAYFILIAFSGILNARTTIVLIAIGAIVMFFMRNESNGNSTVFRIFFFVALLIFVLVFFISNDVDITNQNYEWLVSGIDEIKDLFVSGKKTGYFDVLFNRFLFFPDNILSIILGSGDTPMILIDKNSDVGYIQSIWRFGIIGSLLIYGAYCGFFRSIRRIKQSYSALVIANNIIFFLYQIKLNSLGYSQAGIVLFAICFSMLVLRDNKEVETL